MKFIFKYDLSEFDDKELFGVITDGVVTKWSSFAKGVTARFYKEIQEQTKSKADELAQNLTSYFQNNDKTKDW